MWNVESDVDRRHAIAALLVHLTAVAAAGGVQPHTLHACDDLHQCCIVLRSMDFVSMLILGLTYISSHI